LVTVNQQIRYTDVSRSETVTIHIQGSVEELQADNGQLQQQ